MRHGIDIEVEGGAGQPVEPAGREKPARDGGAHHGEQCRRFIAAGQARPQDGGGKRAWHGCDEDQAGLHVFFREVPHRPGKSRNEAVTEGHCPQRGEWLALRQAANASAWSTPSGTASRRRHNAGPSR